MLPQTNSYFAIPGIPSKRKREFKEILGAVAKEDKKQARNKAYTWLSEQLGTLPEETHIGMFDVDECKKVIEICAPYLK